MNTALRFRFWPWRTGVGLAWGGFIPALSVGFRISMARALHTSLVAMAGGEVVLCSGALFFALLFRCFLRP